jgi:steroid delta-isomerase-like uncharacterized protein
MTNVVAREAEMAQLTEGSEELVRRFIEELPNRGNLAAADELFAPDFVWHVPYSPKPLHGPEAVKETYAAFRMAFPDLRVTIEQLVCQGRRAVALVKASGTDEGGMMGRPASGRRAAWTAVHVLETRDGRIVEDHTLLDQLGLLEQLGHTVDS